MKKKNAGDKTVNQIAIAANKRARRIRRKAARDAAVLAKLKPLLVKMGALQQQIKQLTEAKRREEAS